MSITEPTESQVRDAQTKRLHDLRRKMASINRRNVPTGDFEREYTWGLLLAAERAIAVEQLIFYVEQSPWYESLPLTTGEIEKVVAVLSNPPELQE